MVPKVRVELTRVAPLVFETEAVKKVVEQSLGKTCDQIVTISPNTKSPDFMNLGFSFALGHLETTRFRLGTDYRLSPATRCGNTYEIVDRLFTIHVETQYLGLVRTT